MKVIPLAAIPAETFQIVLDDQQCRITLYQRGRRMYLDLDVGDEAVCRGAICQNRASIVQSPTRLFSGTLHFWDTLGDERRSTTGSARGSCCCTSPRMKGCRMR